MTWKYESERHSLASKGIETSFKNRQFNEDYKGQPHKYSSSSYTDVNNIISICTDDGYNIKIIPNDFISVIDRHTWTEKKFNIENIEQSGKTTLYFGNNDKLILKLSDGLVIF